MEPEEFALVRAMVRSFATRYRVGSADEVQPQTRAAARQALDELGLAELRRTSPPAATVQECALLAEEHGRQPLTTSLLGTDLLAPELLRLLGETPPPARPTIALAQDLRFPGPTPSALVAWDCEGADCALAVTPDGTVRRVGVGPPAPTADLLRGVRTASAGGEVVGRLAPEARQHWQAYALVVVTAELVGTAASFVELSVGYARDRHQYGRPIGSFQAVRHLLADATVQVESCTSAARYAAWCLDHEPPDRALAAARVAKAEANTSAVEAVYAGMQVFGGIAQTWEHIAHLYLRRVLVGARLLATTADLLPALATSEAAR
ncbi:acyl-CoA dehydrogenase family protein [Streptomyces sp. NBS 14/10]|uniref:acyl-CoA dehydrogenase family protein n=1 Tax=Streptomyces sp. NBS 14/10 TaxID=1945643 RepID=UPI000B7DF0ED|nr:acyl-CoA dehydrogenase family protein [Streptomyces sp. NBS 14/10]KAK1184945.1 acyl-CoA dehydrogenase family protein [Streptomyces sp. NBS 14/10]NUS84825.1 acyl-CoA dehydrogenase [Streptomyces sp.]